MQTTAESLIIRKTQELCQVILDQPEFKAIRRDVDAFLANPSAQSLYQSVAERGDSLQQKQRMGQPLDGDEINGFEQDRQKLFENDVTRSFIEAQQSMHKVQESVSQYVAKTFELGRIPSSEDFSSESCGPSCGCDH